MTQPQADSTPLLPIAKPGVMAISPYVGGESKIPGVNRVRKLSSNENPHGSSPAAQAAFAAQADRLALYPDGGHAALRAAIAGVHGLDAARIVCGAGSDEIIALLCKAYAGPGDEVLYSQHGFLMYRLSALAAGATPVVAPETDLTTDLAALRAAITPATRLLFLANPNNPTGTWVSRQQLAEFVADVPRHVLVVIDAAYAEYVTDSDCADGMELVDQFPHVVVTRTFSKIYGLAALRLGWAWCPAHVADVLNRARGPFNVSAPALAAGIAAVEDQDFVARCRADNAQQRAKVTARLMALGIRVLPSQGNFVLAHMGDAPAADAFLKTRGLIVRRMEGYGLGEWLRLTIGTAEDCDALVEAIADWKRGS